MRVLHLFSNHKFTGPADPALVLARTLAERGAEGGPEITWAAGRAPDGAEGVHELGRVRGLATADGLELRKHGRPLPWLRDVVRLRAWLREGRFDLVHTHLPNDHHIAAVAARGLDVPVVRSLYDAEPPRGRRARAAVRRTGAFFAPTEGAARDLAAAYPSAEGRTEVVAPVLDLERFSGERDESIRRGWGVGPEDRVIGVVARMQTHRRFPELIEGFARAARRDTGLHLVVLGRGTHQVKVAHEPAERSGVGDQIHFPGYIDPSEYPAVLPAFDAVLFLVPGSDGTCRAAREAQASGVPVIVASRGLLPELLSPDESGLLLERDEPDDIAEAITTLRGDESLRERLAEGARAFARRTFSAERAATLVDATYRRLVEPSAG